MLYAVLAFAVLMTICSIYFFEKFQRQKVATSVAKEEAIYFRNQWYATAQKVGEYHGALRRTIENQNTKPQPPKAVKVRG